LAQAACLLLSTGKAASLAMGAVTSGCTEDPACLCVEGKGTEVRFTDSLAPAADALVLSSPSKGSSGPTVVDHLPIGDLLCNISPVKEGCAGVKAPASRECSQDTEDSGSVLPSLLENLQGSWTRQADASLMGSIVGDKMIWEASYQHIPSRLTALDNGAIQLELGDDHHWGRWEEPTLKWSDGEVWVRT